MTRIESKSAETYTVEFARQFPHLRLHAGHLQALAEIFATAKAEGVAEGRRAALEEARQVALDYARTGRTGLPGYGTACDIAEDIRSLLPSPAPQSTPERGPCSICGLVFSACKCSPEAQTKAWRDWYRAQSEPQGERVYETGPGFVRARECSKCGHTRCGKDCECVCDRASLAKEEPQGERDANRCGCSAEEMCGIIRVIVEARSKRAGSVPFLDDAVVVALEDARAQAAAEVEAVNGELEVYRKHATTTDEAEHTGFMAGRKASEYLLTVYKNVTKEVTACAKSAEREVERLRGALRHWNEFADWFACKAPELRGSPQVEARMRTVATLVASLSPPSPSAEEVKASEGERVRALEDALRERFVHLSVGNKHGRDFSKCDLCDATGEEDEEPMHRANCLLAKSPTASGEVKP